jgi:CO dehydrogenase/acetyl-CoA synthase gamma subunit (corrinoid Fe-S protein)
VLVTTNFALTYFIVSGEIEASKVPTWLLIKDSEGLSVLTAWAAGKFAGDDVGMFVKKSGITDKIKHQELVIPGYAASIVGDVEEELPGWTITVGPREAAHIPASSERNRNVIYRSGRPGNVSRPDRRLPGRRTPAIPLAIASSMAVNLAGA